MKNTQLKSIKQYSKVVLIISCVFAVAASALIAVSIYGLPQAIKGRQEMKYLYENGIEVDAHIKYYYDDYGLLGPPDEPYHRVWSGRFHIVYEYIDSNNRMYTDEYLDPVQCKSRDALSAREQVIKQMMLDGKTMKMLIADNGLCCLSVYKESLLRPTTVIIYSVILSVSSVVLGFCIFGVVRHSKTLRRFRRK